MRSIAFYVFFLALFATTPILVNGICDTLTLSDPLGVTILTGETQELVFRDISGDTSVGHILSSHKGEATCEYCRSESTMCTDCYTYIQVDNSGNLSPLNVSLSVNFEYVIQAKHAEHCTDTADAKGAVLRIRRSTSTSPTYETWISFPLDYYFDLNTADPVYGSLIVPALEVWHLDVAIHTIAGTACVLQTDDIAFTVSLHSCP